VQAAEAVGASLILGDRPIDITLHRCWSALTWRRRWQLVQELRRTISNESGKSGSKDADAFTKELEELKSDEGVQKAMQQVMTIAPEVMAPLIHERDLYLSWSMKRSKAVNGVKTVVGVVGKGHLRGIMFAMENDPGGHLRFSDLVGGRNTKAFKQRQRKMAVQNLLRDTVIFGALFWAVSQWH
jgi:pheromone shutdown protein TraB